MGNFALKLSATNCLIFSGDPLSWPKNWLQGKARIYNPEFFHFSCILTISVQFSDVNPHLQATLTIIVNFLSLSWLKLYSWPRISLTLKSKKVFGTFLVKPQEPDLKISFCMRPPIINNKQYYHNSIYQYLSSDYPSLKHHLQISLLLYKPLFLHSILPFGFIHHINCNQFNILFSYFYNMQSSDGFRRRGAISAIKSIKTTKSHEDESIQSLDRSFQKNNQIKFNKINQSNHAILKNRKKQQEFQRTIQEIKSRKCTFLKMSFKSYEKQGCKKILGEVLGLGTNQMKGTMHIGQLWASHQSNRFLKENKIYMTKLKLMDKLQILKKEIDEEGAVNKSESQIGSSKSMGTFHTINIPNTRSLNGSSQQLKKMQINQNVQTIKRQLKKLNNVSGQECLNNEIRYLERCKQKLDRVERNYFLKMIQIQ